MDIKKEIYIFHIEKIRQKTWAIRYQKKIHNSKIFLWLKTQYSFFLFRDTGYLWAEIHHGRPRPLLALLGPLNPLPLLSPLPRAVPVPDPEVDGYVVCPPPLPPRL
jgi:hypothetical protein